MGFKDMYYQKAILKILKTLEFKEDEYLEDVFETWYCYKEVLVRVYSDEISIDINESFYKRVEYEAMSNPEDVLDVLDSAVNEVD